jgi:hypothetical protein
MQTQATRDKAEKERLKVLAQQQKEQQKKEQAELKVVEKAAKLQASEQAKAASSTAKAATAAAAAEAKATKIANDPKKLEADAAMVRCSPFGRVMLLSPFDRSYVALAFRQKLCCSRLSAEAMLLSPFDRILYSRMPLVPTPARLKLLHACEQCHSSRVGMSYRLTR